MNSILAARAPAGAPSSWLAVAGSMRPREAGGDIKPARDTMTKGFASSECRATLSRRSDHLQVSAGLDGMDVHLGGAAITPASRGTDSESKCPGSAFNWVSAW